MDENETQDVDLENNDLEEEKGDGSKPDGESVEDRIKTLEKQNADLAKNLAIAKRNANKPAKVEKSEKSQDSTDYGLLAYLNSEGIKHEEDRALFDKVRADTGKKPEEILSSKYFQAELKELREVRESKEAQPAKNNRGGGGSSDEVTNWAYKMDSGKATIDDVPQDLRYQVIQRRVQNSQKDIPGSDFLAKVAAKQARK